MNGPLGLASLKWSFCLTARFEFLTVEGEQMTEAPLRPDRISLLVPMLLQWLSGEEIHAAAIR